MPRFCLSRSYVAAAALMLALSPLPAFALKAKPAAATTQAAAPGAPAVAVPANSDTPIDDRIGIAATVNDEVVTFTDIRNRMKLYLLGAPGAPPPDVRQKIALQVLARLIDERLQMQEAKNLGIAVEDTEVDAAFAHVADNNHLTPDEFKGKLSGAGVHVETLQDQLRAQIAWNMVVRRKLRPQINVSETEIDTEMTRRQNNAGKLEYAVSEILLPVDSDRMDDIVRHGAEKIIEQINHGAPFAQAAKQFSKAPGAAQGGDLGWVQDGQLDAKLIDALKTMQVGQVSAPVRTAKGYEILFLRDKHDAGLGDTAAAAPAPAAPAAAEPDQVVSLKQLVIPTTPNEVSAKIDAKMQRAAGLKSEISSCDAMTVKAGEYSAAGSGDLPKGLLSRQPMDIQNAVRTLPIGKLSAPLLRPAGVTVLMVCAREAAPAGTAPAAAAPAASSSDQTREDIATQLGTKRLEQLQERYLKDLRATAYIEKRF